MTIKYDRRSTTFLSQTYCFDLNVKVKIKMSAKKLPFPSLPIFQLNKVSVYHNYVPHKL